MSPCTLKAWAALFKNKLAVGDFFMLPGEVPCALVLCVFVPCRALAKVGIQEKSAPFKWFCIFKVTRKIALSREFLKKV